MLLIKPNKCNPGIVSTAIGMSCSSEGQQSYTRPLRMLVQLPLMNSVKYYRHRHKRYYKRVRRRGLSVTAHSTSQESGLIWLVARVHASCRHQKHTAPNEHVFSPWLVDKGEFSARGTTSIGVVNLLYYPFAIASIGGGFRLSTPYQERVRRRSNEI